MHVSKLTLALVLPALVVAMVVSTGTAAAGKGAGKGGTTTASITLNESDPHLGDWITFSTSGGSRVAVACYQGGIGNMVYSADQPVGTAFLLGGTSSAWLTAGGEASCYAWLYSRSMTRGLKATTMFNAGGAR